MVILYRIKVSSKLVESFGYVVTSDVPGFPCFTQDGFSDASVPCDHKEFVRFAFKHSPDVFECLLKNKLSMEIVTDKEHFDYTYSDADIKDMLAGLI